MGSDGSANGTTSPKRLSSMGLAWPSGNEISGSTKSGLGGQGRGLGGKRRRFFFCVSLWGSDRVSSAIYLYTHREG